jgi:uncharacterized protein (TIGR03435 family)
MTRVVAGTALAAWFGLLVHALAGADAKPADTKLEFEVASIKPSAMGGRGVIKVDPGGPGNGDPGRVTYNLVTIRDLMVDAYGVKRYQISGGPNWLDSERFDVVAKVPEGATKEQVKVMLQNLLAERFRLTLHRETKELAVYALVSGAKGPKLKESTVSEPAASSPPPLSPGLEKGGMKIGPDGCPETAAMAAGRAGNFMMMTPNGVCLISNGQTMEGLARQLSNRFDRPVIDETGLQGTYDLRLRFDPSSMPGGRGDTVRMKDGPGPAGGDPAERIGADVEAPPSIFDAIQKQLGLKLEAKKGPVDLVVIDHVEKKPTEN